MKSFFFFLTTFFDNPIMRGFSFALWAVPIYFLLDITVVGKDYDIIQGFIEWFGVPYGLLLALVLVNVWTQFEATNRSFDEEADAILMVYDTTLLVLDSSIKAKVCCLLLLYAKHVYKHYDDEFENKTKKSIGDIILNKIRTSVGILLWDKNDKELGLEIIREVNKLIDLRGDRLAHSKQRILPPVFWLSFIASIIWLLPFFALNFIDPKLGIVFITGVTLIVVAILLVILDLDDPITGTWKVKLDSWKDLIETIEKLNRKVSS